MSDLRYARVENCPDADRLHTPMPVGYVQWRQWAEDKAKTHWQKRCPTCGFFCVWVPKKNANPENGEPA